MLTFSRFTKKRHGLEAIFANTIFQINRNLQLYLQKSREKKRESEWRPSAICISKDSFKRTRAFEFLNWISYKYGFGTYLHLIEDYYSKAAYEKSQTILRDLLSQFERKGNHFYVDTLISPSYTSAIAQAIQIPGIAGMENNMVIFEFDRENPENLEDIVENFSLVNSGHFDTCILGSSSRKIDKGEDIHIWIRSIDEENANLMIMLAFILLSHPLWSRSNVRIFDVCTPAEEASVRQNLEDLLLTGRLPITIKNVEIITDKQSVHISTLINQRSSKAGLTIIGFREEMLKHFAAMYLRDMIGSVLCFL